MPNNLKWQIRPALPNETKNLSDLAFRSKSYWGYSDRFMTACRQELTLDRDYIAINPTFLLTYKGRITGFYSLEHVSTEIVELGYLFVDLPSIGRGYGRQLLAHAKLKARHAGYRRISIQGDPNAERFYRTAGGKFAGTKASLSIPGRKLPVFIISLMTDPK